MFHFRCKHLWLCTLALVWTIQGVANSNINSGNLEIRKFRISESWQSGNLEPNTHQASKAIILIIRSAKNVDNVLISRKHHLALFGYSFWQFPCAKKHKSRLYFACVSSVVLRLSWCMVSAGIMTSLRCCLRVCCHFLGCIPVTTKAGTRQYSESLKNTYILSLNVEPDSVIVH